MKVAIAFLLAFASSVATPARAACHFAMSYPIVCTEGVMAAQAYRRFGDDVIEILKSYNQQVLHEIGCGTPYYAPKFKSAVIQIVNSGRVATDTGWVPVSIITVNNKDLWYIPSDYLSGVCDKHKVEVTPYTGPN